jgi:hypothetical protein
MARKQSKIVKERPKKPESEEALHKMIRGESARTSHTPLLDKKLAEEKRKKR